jgi:hypothetical protein
MPLPPPPLLLFLVPLPGRRRSWRLTRGIFGGGGGGQFPVGAFQTNKPRMAHSPADPRGPIRAFGRRSHLPRPAEHRHQQQQQPTFLNGLGFHFQRLTVPGHFAPATTTAVGRRHWQSSPVAGEVNKAEQI